MQLAGNVVSMVVRQSCARTAWLSLSWSLTRGLVSRPEAVWHPLDLATPDRASSWRAALDGTAGPLVQLGGQDGVW